MGIVDSRNFGASTSVDVAGYHYDTYALFGYNLNTLPAWTVVTNARLVLNNIYSAGGSAGTAVLNLVNDSTSWSEMTVTRRTTPAYTAIGTVNVPVSGAASYDVTAQVSNAVKAANAEISFMFTHTGNGNFFIDSKENTSGKATAIEVYAVAAAPVVSGYIETRWYVIGQVIRSCFMYLNFTEPAGFEGKVDHYEVYTSSDNGATWSFWFNQYGPSMNLSWTYGNKATICVSAVDTAGNKSKKSNILFLQ